MPEKSGGWRQAIRNHLNSYDRLSFKVRAIDYAGVLPTLIVQGVTVHPQGCPVQFLR